MRTWTVLAAAGVCLLTALVAHTAEGIQAFELDSMARIVESQKGKPFVLVIWSLDCEYCGISMKNLAQEKRKRGSFNIVTLSTDSATEPDAVALMKKKLQSVGMTANAWAYSDAIPEQLRYAIDPSWYGEKPRSYWFNAHGESIAHSGVISAAVIEKFAQK
jgi:hypothetical protein